MTGATSGIGLVASRLLLDAGNELMIGARSPATVPVDEARRAKVAPLDLERLGSVRHFATAVEEWLSGTHIDGLVLNAGTQVSDMRHRTEDGFETTFAVNHLAHYLLLRLLMPRLAPGAIVVITTSNLHDPKTNAIAPPEHADAGKLAAGQVRQNPNSQDSIAPLRAYAASKLCNLLTARALASSTFAQERGLRVVAFNPGFTPGTRLTRRHPLAFRLFFAARVAVLRTFQRMNTANGGGSLLADIALGQVVPPDGRFYVSQVKRQLTWPDPSELAGDNAVMMKLWRDSAALVDLPE
ncbi:MAG: SDR family NAD(P)-dependent oxidoreductase [Methylovirgula sp.]|uniref:SDR family NAD(P)-dependent oxidoreductase n=1 Tax=Methylovirgula sp. TaxID=1978224 RepID=UPI0030761D2E